MLNDEKPPIHGDGKQSRDFTFVANVVQANILAATTPLSCGPLTVDRGPAACEVFNVACGDAHSILGLVKVLNRIMGKSIEPVFTPPRAGDVMRTLADIFKIKVVLDYEPGVNFEEGLHRTVEAFACYRKEFVPKQRVRQLSDSAM